MCMCEQAVLQVREGTVQSHSNNNSPHLLYTTLAHTSTDTDWHIQANTICIGVHTSTQIPRVCVHMTLLHSNTNMWCMSHCTQWSTCRHTGVFMRTHIHTHCTWTQECTCTNTHHTTNRGPMYTVEGDNSVCCYFSSVILYIASLLVISPSALCTVHTGVHMHP